MEEELPVIKKENIDDNIDKQIDNVITKKDINKEENTTTNNTPAENANTEANTETTTAPSKNTTVTANTQEEAKKVEETPPSTIEDVKKDSEVAKVEPKPVEKKVNQFVKVIKIQTNSKDIYKSYLDKIYSVNDNVTLCRDYKNNVEIFVGPFENDVEREKISRRIFT